MEFHSLSILGSLHEYRPVYRFWVGFDLLGGDFLKLASTDFLGSSIALLLLGFFGFEEKEATAEASSNLLGWFLCLG